MTVLFLQHTCPLQPFAVVRRRALRGIRDHLRRNDSIPIDSHVCVPCFDSPRPTILQEIQQAMMDYQSNSNGFENASKWYSEIGLPLTHADRRR